MQSTVKSAEQRKTQEISNNNNEREGKKIDAVCHVQMVSGTEIKHAQQHGNPHRLIAM